MQSVYDLYHADPILHQAYMDKILIDTDKKIKIKVMRERQQRRLTNQRNASWIVETCREKIEGVPVLIL